jgi:uncharacterized protein YjiS (DUF1127 family)
MSAIDTYRLSPRNGRVGMIARVIDAMTLWNDARLTRRALGRLSDRELNDIGLTRFDIDTIGR